MTLKAPVTLATALSLVLVTAGPALAKVPPEEAARLGKDLTPVGAIKAGNADGTIPEWTGESNFIESDKIITPKDLEKLRKDRPATLEEMIGRAGEKLLFTINKDNYKQYADKLTRGHQAMFERWPDYKMNVYQSVRTAFYPKEIYEATRENASRAYLEGTDTLIDAKLGFPFPIPKSGAEVIWNHKLKFRGSTLSRINNEAVVQADGNYQISKSASHIKFIYANLKEPQDSKANLLFYYMGETLEPARVAGSRVLVIEKIDESDGGRNVWIFNPGIGRPQKISKAGYDVTLPASDGELLADQADMFNGALDRYDWKLVGRKEFYIAYNAYKINGPRVKYADIIRPGHVNRDLVRYELHRVWVVEATLRDGMTHLIKKRTFYVDEDSWSIAAVDCYDNQDKLWKLQEAHLITLPFIPTVTGIPEAVYDLQSGRYFVTGLTQEEEVPDWQVEFRKNHFSQRTLTRRNLFR